MGDSEIVPVVSIIGGLSLAGLFWFMVIRAQVRARELLHAERQAAIAKGLPPPEEPPNGATKETTGKAPAHTLKMGIFWLFLGLGIILAMRIADPASPRWAWGIIVVAIGLADLVYWLVRGRAEENAARRDEGRE